MLDPIIMQQAKDGMGIIKDAIQLVKSLLPASGSSKHKAEMSELYEKLTEAYSTMLEIYDGYQSLAAEKRDLEEQMAKLKDWDEQKSNYRLVEVVAKSGVFAYAYTPKGNSTETPHLLCQKCYEEGKKSILQTQNHSTHPMLKCPGCRTELQLPPPPLRQPKVSR